MNDYKMKIATIEKFFGENETRKIYNQDKRNEALNKFPFTAIVEGSYPTNDFAARWCWQQFGPMDCKECAESYSEYPGCPLVQATEYLHHYTYKDSDGTMKEDSEKCYKKPEVHGHEGNWTIVWLGKTGYDYGFSEYYFKDELSRDKFVQAVPDFDLGENYDV
jgi:hypothetical protein